MCVSNTCTENMSQAFPNSPKHQKLDHSRKWFPARKVSYPTKDMMLAYCSAHLVLYGRPVCVMAVASHSMFPSIANQHWLFPDPDRHLQQKTEILIVSHMWDSFRHIFVPPKIQAVSISKSKTFLVFRTFFRTVITIIFSLTPLSFSSFHPKDSNIPIPWNSAPAPYSLSES